MLELVGIGDLHFDKLTRLLGDRFNPFVGAELKKPLRYARRNGISFVLLYGDFCERARMSYEGHLAFIDAVEEYSDLTFFCVPGNHDFDEFGRHSMQILERFYKNLKVFVQPKNITIRGIPFRMLPHPHTDTAEDRFNVIHHEVKGSKTDSGMVSKSQLENDHVCFAGHLHTPHRIRNTFYSGTLYQTNFGESMPKSFHHIRIESLEDYTVTDVPNKPAIELINLEITKRADLKKIRSEDGIFYKLFIQADVVLEPNDLAAYPNVVRVNRYKTKAELEQMLEEEWKTEEAEAVFQPEDDLNSFLSAKKVDADLALRVVKFHNKRMEDWDGSAV